MGIQGDSRTGDDAGTVWCGDLSGQPAVSIEDKLWLWCLDSQIFTDQVQKIYGIRGGYKGVAWLQTKDERIGKVGEIEKHDRYDRYDRYRLMMCLYTHMTKE